MVSALGWWRVVGALVAGVLLASACGSSGSSAGSASSPAPASSTSASSSAPATASSGTTANAEVCQDVAALRTSLSRLSQVTVSRGAASKLAADVKDVQAKVSTLVRNAGTRWSTQIGALTSALSTLQTAVTGLANGGSLSSVVSALRGVRSAAQNLLAAAGAQCPSPESSP